MTIKIDNRDTRYMKHYIEGNYMVFHGAVGPNLQARIKITTNEAVKLAADLNAWIMEYIFDKID